VPVRSDYRDHHGCRGRGCTAWADHGHGVAQADVPGLELRQHRRQSGNCAITNIFDSEESCTSAGPLIDFLGYWGAGNYPRAISGAGGDVEFASDQVDPLAHADQTESGCEFCSFHIEADTVIGYL
jgi:hypothetical protein